MATAAPASEDDAAAAPVASLLLKLRLRDSVSDHEARILAGAVDRVKSCPANHLLVAAGEPLTHSILLVEGVVARHKDLADGQRQITELHVPGDFVDLHGYLLKRLEHHVSTLTPARLAFVPHSALTQITEREPHLGRLLWLSTMIDGAVQRERILSIGRRTALGRIAHLVCELFARLEVVGLTDGDSFALPITQMDLADATGLTSVHVNRMLRQLRSEGLMTFRSGTVEIHDLPRLEQVAEFDRSYLFLSSQPR
jgi:CRP-like cAMP-binding protein